MVLLDIYANTEGDITISNNIIAENTANSGHGGGVYASLSENITFINNTIAGNSAHGLGGGVYIPRSANATFTNNVISGNLVEEGGGVYLFSGFITFTNNTITGNTAGQGPGGGVCAGPSNSATFNNNSITGNTAGRQGGGVFTSAGGSVTFINNTIMENTSNDNGGGGLGIAGNGPHHISNNIIARNTSNVNGGGVFSTSSGPVTFINNNVTENTAENNGGGIYIKREYNTVEANLSNNIIWNNAASFLGNDVYIDNDGNEDYIPSPVNLFNNDFNQSPEGTYIQIPFTIDPSNLDNEDPLFVDPANGDYHLGDGSPCTNAGDNSAPELPETDMDGDPRIMDSTVDIGADEYPGPSLPIAKFSADSVSGGAPLTVNFTDESAGTVDSWEWDFGDGSPVSDEENPIHIYEDSGSYTVSLTATNAYGSDTEVKEDYITVTVAEPVPDIKANGLDGPVNVIPIENVNITIALDSGSMQGEWFDWWIGVISSYGTIPFLGQPIPLFDLPETTLLDIPLPIGIWLFYFILDDNPNGIFDSMRCYDYVVVIVEP